MELTIVRHGIAHPLGEKNDFSDDKRTLTATGRDRMREGARGLKRLGIKPDIIMTSPLARGLETAEIVAEGLGVEVKFVIRTENLAPGLRIEALFAEIKGQPRCESVVLVGHEPDLGIVAARIACGAGGFSLPLKKGGACNIRIIETVPTFRGQLGWLASPKMLRLLAKA